MLKTFTHMKHQYAENLNKRGNFVKKNAETAINKMEIIEGIIEKQKKNSVKVGQVQERKNNLDVLDRENKLMTILRR